MDLRSIYVANGAGVFVLLLLYYASRSRIQRHRIEDRLFRLMVFGVMLGCIMEALSYTLDGETFAGARLLNYAVNTYLFSFNLLLPFGLLVYVDLGLYGDPGRILKRYKPQIAVGAVMLALTVLNFFVPVCYYITPQNVYERRPMLYVYYLVILYYFVSSIVLTKRYERENGAHAFFSINLFLIPVITGVGLQFMLYGLSLAWLSSAVGLVGLFMMQQNEMAYIDSLVDTYNRQYMDNVISAWIARNRRFVGAMLDIDRFKEINDTYGHSEGDKALKAVTGILKQARTDREWVFRFAGDEFVILKLSDSPDGLSDYLAEVNKRVAEYNRGGNPYPLSLSYGVSFFQEGNLDSFLKEVDGRMYQMKAQHHQGGSPDAL